MSKTITDIDIVSAIIIAFYLNPGISRKLHIDIIAKEVSLIYKEITKEKIQNFCDQLAQNSVITKTEVYDKDGKMTDIYYGWTIMAKPDGSRLWHCCV